jgi:hypothetical protein
MIRSLPIARMKRWEAFPLSAELPLPMDVHPSIELIARSSVR